jgi:hypothetical protein
MNRCGLSNALCSLLPETVVTRRRETDWHSATFSGRRIVLSLRTNASATDIAAFTDALVDHEFSVPGLLVADIAVTAQHGDALTVEALLLD